MQQSKRLTRKEKAQQGKQRVVKEKFMEQREEAIKAKPLVALNKKQQEYIELLKEKPVVIATGYAGTSKAQPLYSKVLTTSGWKTMGEIKIGEDVVTPDNSIAKVIDVFDFSNKPVYEFTLKSGRKVRSCIDHLWKVRETSKNSRQKASETRVLTTEYILSNFNKSNFSIPLASSIGHNDDYEFLIHPYVLGLLISEGCLKESVRFTTPDEFVVQKVSELVAANGYSVKKVSSKYDYRITDLSKGSGFVNIYKQELERLGLYGIYSHEKFIPDYYTQNMSINQKFQLLHGLMDGDGSVSSRRKNGCSIYYSTSSEVLANDVFNLVLSLGCYASVRERESYYTKNGTKVKCRNSFNVYINSKNPKQLFSLPRKVELCSDEYQGGKYELMDKITDVSFVCNEDVRCILLDSEDHLYLTDNYVVTHNTYIPTVMAADLYKLNQIQKIIITRPAVSTSKSMGFFKGTVEEKMAVWLNSVIPIFKDRLGQAMFALALETQDIEFVPLEVIKGMSINNAWVLCEESSDLTKDEVIKLVTRMGKNSKLVLSGDVRQSELKGESGLVWISKFVQRHNLTNNFGFIDFNDVNDIVRSDAVKQFIVALTRDERKGIE